MINEKVEIFEKAFAQMRNEELGIGETIDSEEHKKLLMLQWNLITGVSPAH